MNQQNEQSLLSIIKYSPLIIIITISIILSSFIYKEETSSLEREQLKIRAEYIKSHKEKIEKEVNGLYEFIVKTQKRTEEKLKENIKNRVYEAHSIAMTIYNENKDKKSKEEIIKMIKDALVNIRFNNQRGYFFIYSFDYECILLPINRKLEGTSFYNFKDGDGNYLTRNIIEQVKKEKEGFLTWSYQKPNDSTETYKKIGFNIYFEPYDWFIGTGEYFVDYENDVKQSVLEYLSTIAQDKKDYFFILDFNEKMLFHFKKELINKKAKDIKNIDVSKTFDDMVTIAKLGEGFLTYNYQDLSSGTFMTKTSYIKGLNNWQWLIGKGFYQNDLEEIIHKKIVDLDNDYKEEMTDIFSIFLFFTIILIFISIYISKLLEKKFDIYKKEINKYIKENSRQQQILAQQSKMAAMGEMLGNIAHQWRQPLSVISTVATGMRLQKEFGKLDDENFEEAIDSITNSTTYLSRTIDDFRNFFRTDKDESFFIIKDSFEKVLKLIDSQFKNHDITIKKYIEDIEIHGFENEFIQVLINILNNSKDALLNKNYQRYIIISAKKENNMCIIKITDNGGGIKDKILDKIFEPYFTTKHQSSGTGIGLYMTKEIIEKHMGGTVNINNVKISPNEFEYSGTEVVIKLKI
jgi:signal transduction histidine kinase